MSSVVLVGFMGAGKTTIGSALARIQKLLFHDLDKVLERRFTLSIPEVFAHHGEPAFREAESLALRDALSGPAAVIATGGGAFCVPATRALVRQAAASSVYLEGPWELLWQRIAATAASRSLNAGVTKLIVSGPFTAVRKDFVGLFGFLETLLSDRIIRVTVRVVLHRQTAIRFLQFVFTGAIADAENFIVITFCHDVF